MPRPPHINRKPERPFRRHRHTHRRATPPGDKTAVICLVRGVVVGGRPLAENEGIYLVRIPGDRSAKTLFDAVDRLRPHPQVLFAGPETMITGQSARRPDDRQR